MADVKVGNKAPDFALPDAERDIHATGFFRQKAKSLRGVMESLIGKYEGAVPSDMKALTGLPGVGRKTANVILGNAFGIPGIVVDTHVSRVSRRIGLTSVSDPVKIESQLGELYPKKEWTRLSHCLIFHGRYTCKAKKPSCDTCTVNNVCDTYRDRFQV